jgi:hypothetical protein
MTRRWILGLVLIGIACSTNAVDAGFAGHAAWAASPVDQQILNAVTSLQNSLGALQNGAISDLQSRITALQSALSTLQDSVTVLQNELIGSGRSNVRFSSTVDVAPDENAGCTIVNVSSGPLEVHTQLLDFTGTVLSEATRVYQPGQAQSAAGLNEPGGSSQIPVYCKFTVLTAGRSRSDIRGHVEHVQRHITVPAE